MTNRKYIATWTVTHTAIIDAGTWDEAADKFTAGEYTDEREDVGTWDVTEACATCLQPEDADGRCGCTNKDAAGI